MKVGVDIDDILAQTIKFLIPQVIKLDKDVFHKKINMNNNICLYFKVILKKKLFMKLSELDERLLHALKVLREHDYGTNLY